MSENPREFDELLESILQRSAGGEQARNQVEIPTEVSGEELQLLQIALELRAHLTPEGPDDEFLHNSEIRLKNRIRARLKRTAGPSKSRRQNSIPGWRRLLRPIPVVASLLLVLALTLGSVGVVGASAASLPGDTLYPLKRGWETARLAISLSDKGDAQLLAAFASERVEEIETLIDLDRFENVGEAVQSYLDLTEQLQELSGEDGSFGEFEGEVANNIEVLQRVLEQVPVEAQPAIQRAIERSQARQELRQQNQAEQQANPGQGQGKPTDTPGQGQGLEHESRTAQQIADQYEEVTLEQVQQQFEGACESDWQCVRDHFRVMEQNRRFAEQIARQNETTPEAVMGVFEGTCGFDWQCVRAHFRQKGKP